MDIEEILGVTDKYWSLSFKPGGKDYLRASELLSKAGYAWFTNDNRTDPVHMANIHKKSEIKDYVHFDLMRLSKVIHMRSSNSEEHASWGTYDENNKLIFDTITQVKSLELLESLLIIHDINI